MACAVAMLHLAPFYPRPADASLLHPIVVSDNPSDDTPTIVGTSTVPEPHVDAIGQLGDTIFAGGLFEAVAIPGRSQVHTRSHFMAFNASTGVLKALGTPGFVDPTFDDQVWAIATYGDAVYVGGTFTTVNGITRRRLVKINAATGAVDTAFNARLPGGIVWDLKVWGGPDGQTPMLVVAGSMTNNRLLGLNLTTGADTGYFNLDIADPIPNAWGDVSLYRIAIDPAGTRLVATGNFMTVSGESRTRLFVADLSGPEAAVDPW